MDVVIKCLSDDRAVEQILPEETIPESHASLGALGKDTFERCDSTLKINSFKNDTEEEITHLSFPPSRQSHKLCHSLCSYRESYAFSLASLSH